MQIVKVAEATSIQIDYLVAQCEAAKQGTSYVVTPKGKLFIKSPLNPAGRLRAYSPTSNWALMGPIIEREKIDVYYGGGEVAAAKWKDLPGGGQLLAKVRHRSTVLSAAARCYVISELGEEVEIPEVLA